MSKIQEDLFSKEYYHKVIKENGYSEVDFNTINFELDNFDIKSMQRRFLCHHKGDLFAEKQRAGEKSIVTTGFGMSGYPHLGSISQVVKILELNKAGITTQVVLGDLDSYCARNQKLQDARDYAKKFENIFMNLGYLLENNSVIRDQYSHPSVNLTAYLVSKYIYDSDFVEATEDISGIYEKEGIYDGWSFAMKQALTLMIADFVHLYTNYGYTNILVMLGLEEHKYVQLATKVVERMELPINIGGIYGRIIKGLSGFPKMSKSLKGSSIDVLSSLDYIYSVLLSQPRDKRGCKEDSVFLIIEQVSFYSADKMSEVENVFYNGTDQEWYNLVKDYIDSELVNILKMWN